METILKLDKVSYFYRDGNQTVNILSDSTFEFDQGKIYAIVGESGTGKTTTAILAGGLDSPKSGTVLYQEKNINQIGLNRYRREKVSIVFQSYNLIHYLNALDNVMSAIDISKKKIPNKKDKCLEILESLGLTKKEATRKINRLSGGQQQRVAIARALAKNVDLIIADEPTGNLDEKNSKEIISMLVDIAHNKNKCVILVTHSVELAKKCDYQLTIDNGKIVEQ